MKKSAAREYVIENARYMPDSPNTPYFVRWPNPYATKIFFSDDTDDLVEKVFRFANTKRGREILKDKAIAEKRKG